MIALADQRCWNHPSREAVVRCPSCTRFYCRECVIEHQGRMICTTCLSALAAEPETGRISQIRWTAAAIGGLLLAWLIFYYLGVFLARIPSDFLNTPA